MTNVPTEKRIIFLTRSIDNKVSKQFSIDINFDKISSRKKIKVDIEDFARAFNSFSDLVAQYFVEKGSIEFVQRSIRIKKKNPKKTDVVYIRVKDLENISTLFANTSKTK